MSLLGRLLRLHAGSVPIEDFFTEAVAHLLQAHPDLCLSWFGRAGLLGEAEAGGGRRRVVGVETQRTLAALEHHPTASRPDIAVELSGEPEGSGVDLVFVESKVASGDGPGQLKRYAEQLAALEDPGNRALFYVTRDYDPKDPEEVVSGGAAGAGGAPEVRFVQGRWGDFYGALARYQSSLAGGGSDLIAEVMAFMEEQGMARRHRLSGADLEALSRGPRVLSILEETVSEAAARLQGFAGRRPKQYGTSAGFVRRYGVYSPICTLGADESWYCGLGYVLDPAVHRHHVGAAGTDYPVLRAFLEIPPETPDRAERARAMREMVERRPDWTAHDLERTGAHSSIVRAKSLTEILPEEDHVAAIKAFFLESLGQLEEFRAEYPHLPWGGAR